LTYILNIETATKNCSVSIAKNGQTIALQELNDGKYSHAEKLHEFIKNVMDEVKIKFADLKAVAVSKGPGSYTGLRIGVSTAKGICFALDIPLIVTDTLQALAMTITIENGIKIPLLDARRMEVYSSVFTNKNEQIRAVKAEVITTEAFLDYLNEKKVYFLGDGAAKCKELITHKNAVFEEDKFPSANEMGILSYSKFKNQEFEDVAYFEPFYLKDFLITISKK
jgi:tRNA threonylcarbamoyladenosine biosynthesis protein TsaB